MTTNFQVQQLQLIDDATMPDEVQKLVSPTRATFGFVPNMYRAMGNQPALLETYLDGYRRFRSSANFTATEQEVVFLAISYDNTCHYCSAAHSMVADKVSDVPTEVLTAIRDGKTIPDQRLAALFEAATEMSASRGRPSESTIARFLEAGYTETDLLSIVLAVSVKVISNYSNHLFNTPVDEAFAQYTVE